MGSLGTPKDEVTVLVTGFGPFKEQYPVNPSGEIATSLPEYLPPERAKGHSAHSSPRDLPVVRILSLPTPVRTSYEVVRNLIPKLWGNDTKASTDLEPGWNPGHPTAQGQPKIDYAIHIGMAGPQLVYSLERRGHRDGYDKKDVDERLLEDEERREREGDKWIWNSVPEDLVTDLKIEDVYRRWVERSPTNVNLQISEDAGRYLCDFIYFSSMAHLYKQQRPRKAVFLHIPLHANKESLVLGEELILNLIRSIVESEHAH